jgi:hypothetical protein
MLTPYRAATPAERRSADVERLIETVAWHVQRSFLDEWSGTPEVHDRAAMRALAAKVVDAGCDEPHALMAAAWALMGSQYHSEKPDRRAEKVVAAAHAGLAKAGAHPLLRYLLTQQVRATRGHMTGPIINYKLDQALPAEWVPLAIASIESGVFDRLGRDVSAAMLGDWNDYHADKALEGNRKLRDAVRACAAADEWLRETIDGRYQLDFAWHARGRGPGASITEEGGERFRALLKEARTHLERAAAIDPKAATPAALMISVAMAQNDLPGCEKWFEAAIGAQYDLPDAWVRFMWAVSPEWLGSLDKLKRVGTTAVAAEDYSTRVPWYLIEALRTAAAGSSNKAGVNDAETQALVRRICQGYRRQPPPGMSVQTIDTNEAVFAYLAGDFRGAADALRRAGDGINKNIIRRTGTDETFMRNKSYALSSDRADDVLAALETDARRPRLGQAAFARLLASLPPGHDARPYAAFSLRRNAYLADFAEGKVVRLLESADDLSAWYVEQGRPDVAGGRVRAVAADGELRMTYRPPVTGDYVLRGTLELAAAGPGGNRAFVAVLVSANWFKGIAHYAIEQSDPKALRVPFATVSQFDRPGGGPVRFEAFVTSEGITLVVDGKTLVADERVNRQGHNSVGLRILLHGSAAESVTVSDLTLQRVGRGGAKPPGK